MISRVRLQSRRDMITMGLHDHMQYGISMNIGGFISIVIDSNSKYRDKSSSDRIYYCGQSIPPRWVSEHGIFGEHRRKKDYRNWLLYDAITNGTDIVVFVRKGGYYYMLDKLYKVVSYTYDIHDSKPINIVFTLE